MRSSDVVAISRAVIEFLILAAFTIAVPLIVFCDTFVFKDGVGELSATEILQELLLLVTTVIWWREAARRPEVRGFMILVGGFFGCMLIRELDFAFDIISLRAWLWPALLVAVSSIGYAWQQHWTIVPGMATYVGRKSFIYLSIGLLFGLVFSRMYGSGALLWMNIMGGDYNTVFKASVQEGLELYGYLFVAYASWLIASDSTYGMLGGQPVAVDAKGIAHDTCPRSTDCSALGING